MKNLFAFVCSIAIIIGASIFFSNCNPKCDPVGSISLSADNNPAGYQILIKATPATSLLGKTISFGNEIVPDTSKKFIENVGMVVTVPKNAAGSTKLKIEDLDFDTDIEKCYFTN